MSLPSGYTELEYIESTGTQYVDTDFVPSDSPRIELDMMVLDDGDVDVFGTATSTAPCWILNFDTDNGGTIYYRYYSSSYKSYSYASNGLVNRRANYSVGQTLAIDGTTYLAMTEYDFSSFTQTVRLFGGRSFALIRVYACKIYNGGTLVRDFVPCRSALGVAGLWDDLNGVFYGNAGAGTFVEGPEIVVALDPPAAVEQVINVKLAWTSVENATFYRVYRDGVLLGETEDTTYVDESAELGQTYVYGITACRVSAESAPTELTVYTREGYAVIRPVVTTANFP